MTDHEREPDGPRPASDEAPGTAGDKAGDMGKGSFEESHEGDGKGPGGGAGAPAGGAGARPDRGSAS
ncbi:MAG: hypothetical protein ACJ8DZ_10910 [Allosphingosinicella sp.]